MYAKSFVALIAATAVSAAPAAKVARDDAASPWQITRLITHTPSGNPGNSPYSTLNVTIRDPNVISAGQTATGTAVFPATTGTCSIQYITDADVPWGVEQACTTDADTAAYSTWTFTVNRPTDTTGDASTNFDLKFKLVDSVQIPGQVVTKTFTGGDHFEVWGNMGGQCGGSGVCNWSLRGTPYDINQTEEDA